MTPRMLFESSGAAGATGKGLLKKQTNVRIQKAKRAHVVSHTRSHSHHIFMVNGATDPSFSEFTICYGYSYFHSVFNFQYSVHSNQS